MVHHRLGISLLVGMLAAILAAGSIAIHAVWHAAVDADRAARDEGLRATALTVVTRLQPQLESEAWNWSPAEVRGLIPAGDIPTQVFVPAAEAPGRWRLLTAAPERAPDTPPLNDPEVSRAITLGAAPITWLDPTGSPWRSFLCTITDRQGAARALIETRVPGDGPPFPGSAVGALIALVAAVGIGGLALVTAARERIRSAEPSAAPGPVVEVPLPPRPSGEFAELRSQMAKVQSADRAKTSLLVALCRSLRQSVETLRSAGSLLAQTRLDRTQRDYLDSLQAGCGDLQTRIGDVLDFALLEAECLSLEQRPLRPRLVLEEALAIVAERCVQLPIELAWIADAEVPERVIGDLARIRQVLVNLVSLAATTAEEGTVVVRLSIGGADRLVFHISLVGVTLTAERIRLLLEGAISSDSSSDLLHGEGLGLMLGKRLALAMGGSLTVERGDDGTISLLCQLRIQPDDVSPERPLEQRRFIVGHDRPATAGMIAAILTRAGAVVELAADRETLLQRIRTEPLPQGIIGSSRLVAIDAGLEAAALAEGVSALSAGPPLLLVVDPIHRGMSAELRAAGAAALLSMPVRQQALLSAATEAIAGSKRDSSLTPALTGAERQRRVLVVEDNPVNQLVMVRMLEAMGIHPEVATNGREAVDRVAAAGAGDRPYALLLMDCMMPVMDGLQATRAIRTQEERQPRPWIIAVTANALANDRMRCLEAGMDDYLPKPVTPVALADALGRWRESTGMLRRGSSRVSRSLVATSPPATPAPAVVEPVTDFSSLRTLTRLAGAGAMGEVVGCFLEEAPPMLEGLRTASADDDRDRLRSLAHKLKGSCGTVGLRAAQHAAGAIERAADDGDGAAILAHLDLLAAHLADGCRRLQDFRDSPGT